MNELYHNSLSLVIFSSRLWFISLIWSMFEFIWIKINIPQFSRFLVLTAATLCCFDNCQYLSGFQCKTFPWVGCCLMIFFIYQPIFYDTHVLPVSSLCWLSGLRTRNLPNRLYQQYGQHNRCFHLHLWTAHHFSTSKVHHSVFQVDLDSLCLPFLWENLLHHSEVRLSVWKFTNCTSA